MAGRINAQDLAAVRDRSPIADVVGHYVQLRPAGGGSLKGLCPFHDERTPSFHVTPARGVYYCFGCGEGGDVITFVEKVDHLGFAEAVEKLAVGAGITLRYEQGGSAGQVGSQRGRLVAAHAAAVELYADLLTGPEAAPARQLLAGRGFDRAAAERFGCGYAPAAWDTLAKHLQGRGFGRDELVTAGLCRVGRSGGLVDRFRGRLLWPIRDLAGDTVGFGARRLREDDDGPKYLNTPETPIFHKGSLLYGVDLAKREIARRHQAVVVEGYTDVMAAHLAGVPTAVATCGTAFGQEHVGILRRLLMDQDEFRGEVVFTFDGDEAGRKAALRAFADDQRFVLQTYVAVQADGLDPCDLRMQQGDAAVRDLVASRRPLVEFVLESTLARHDLDTAEGRVLALGATAPVVARIKDVALRPEYARWLAGRLGMELPVVADAVGRSAARAGQAEPDRGGRRAQVPAPRPVRPATDDDPVRAVEREALKLAVQRPELAGPMFDALPEDAFGDPALRVVRRAVADAGGTTAASPGRAWVAAVGEVCPDDSARSTVLRLAVEPLRSSAEPDGKYVAAVVARLQEVGVTRSVAELKSRLQRVNPVASPEEYAALFGELVALEQYRRGLREQAIGTL